MDNGPNEILNFNEELNDLKIKVEEERENIKTFIFNNQLMRFKINNSRIEGKHFDDGELFGNFKFETISYTVITYVYTHLF